MKRIHFIIALAILFNLGVNAQEKDEKTFEPSGKPFMKIFTNYHSDYSDGTHSNVFQIQRAYLGYSYKFSENFSGKITLDVGNPEEGKLEMTAYLKNALIKYKYENLTVNFGLISTTQFKAQEKNWGYRYIFKSFQDQNKFGSSADLGLNVDYKFADFISADLSILNGEGYKTADVDTIVKVGVGTTIKPTDDFILRVYYDKMGTSIAQQTLSFFAGYKGEIFSLGGEYSSQSNNKEVEDQDFSGYSFYSTYKFGKKLKIFGRYDKLTSEKIGNATDPWNISKDGQQIILGFEYAPVKGVKFSPNFRNWSPDSEAKYVVNSIFFNCEIKF